MSGGDVKFKKISQQHNFILFWLKIWNEVSDEKRSNLGKVTSVAGVNLPMNIFFKKRAHLKDLLAVTGLNI